MVELLLLLLFVSLITAALTPVVTRKHFKTPKPTNHGAYACYYRLIYDGAGKITGKKLHEARFSGKALNTVIFDRDVTRCTFEPPQKVSYFHVSAIGGGGGGGDSGYTGGTYNTLGPYTEQLSPLGITAEMISESQRDITGGDLSSFGGQLYGYVHGAASGKGGDQNYTYRNDSTPCVEYHYETYTSTYTSTSTTCSSSSWVSECPESGCDTSSKHDSDSDTSSTDKGDYDDYTPPDTSCGGTSQRCKRTERKCSPTSSSGCYTPNNSFINGGSPGECAQNGGVYGTSSGESCSEECAEYESVPGNCSYNLKDNKLKLDLPKFRFYDPNAGVAFLHPKYAFLFSKENNNFSLQKPKDNLLSYYHCNSWTTNVSTSTSVHSNKVCDRHRNYYTYGIATYTGGAGAPGATCRSGYKGGQLNLALTAGSLPNDGAAGSSCFNASYHSSEWDSPSWSSKVCSSCPASQGQAIPGGSTITFGGQTVTAQNALSGGTGATCEGNGSAGTAGSTCSGGTTVTEGCSPGRMGYCLQRHHRSTWEANASYEFKFTFSQNYLQYGEAGLQGQYRTMIIRSFKQDNIPITLGIGGAAGVNGGQGISGTETIFGDIMRAKGGEGGQGGFLTPPEVLTGYRTGAESWAAGTINGDYVPNKRIVRQEGGKEPEKPKPDNLSSNILNFLVPQDNEKITKIMDENLIGYGGKGGGSQHNCWFGEYRKWLDDYSGYGELAHSYKMPPTSCTNNFQRIDPLPGRDGALIIRW